MILACMRMLMYLTPILWDVNRIEGRVVERIIKINPVYYIVSGYRDCFFYHEGILSFGAQTGIFWGIIVFLFFICILVKILYAL